jgi:hypothetical protein
MATSLVTFDAEYSSELIAEASFTFRDYLFRRYGRWLMAACVVNAIGLALSIWLGSNADSVLTGISVIVVLGPIWLAYKYFVGPSRYAARLKAMLPASGRTSVGSESVALVVRGKEVAIPWTLVKVVLETEGLFLLVLSPLSFVFIPRRGLPTEVYETLHAKSQLGAV